VVKPSTKIKHICFDLDGTLVNSNKTIYKTTIRALEDLGIKDKVPEEPFNKLIGLHFVDIFSQFNIPVHDFDQFIEIYKRHYFDFIDDSKPYDGILEVLKYLKENNIRVSLLTTKGQDQAEKITNHFKLQNYFDEIMGRRNGMAHKPSPDPLLFICEELKIPNYESMMVGDTELDIQCGKNAGAKTCAAAYGYRTQEHLKNEQPDFIIEHPTELISILEKR
jgi:HAD superfamily hydrolase (TIGR01549 family)